MRDEELYLHQMLDRCRRIMRFIRPGKEAFLAKEDLQDAVIWNVYVISEAAKRVPPQLRAQLEEMEWDRICGLRDALVRNDLIEDLEKAWTVAYTYIPELQLALEWFLSSSEAPKRR